MGLKKYFDHRSQGVFPLVQEGPEGPGNPSPEILVPRNALVLSDRAGNAANIRDPRVDGDELCAGASVIDFVHRWRTCGIGPFAQESRDVGSRTAGW